ncbi:MAG: hypothetical protein ACI8QC_004340 [Planctomycetota bacterium]|jgi:hypothetical protein
MQLSRPRSALILAALVFTSSTLAYTQDGDRQRGAAGAKAEAGKDKIKAYDEVITDEFSTESGLFLVHNNAGEVYFEIPSDALGTDLLWVTQLSETQAGFGYGGTPVGDRVVRWERRGDEILLRDIKYTIRGDAGDTVQNSVSATSLAPIIEIFPIKAWGKDQAPVIHVTGLFVDDLPEFSAKSRLSAQSVDKKRTFVDSVKAFPTNIETQVFMTYKLGSGESARSGAGRPRRGPQTPSSRRDRSQGAVTVKLHHSMVKLPERPAQVRVHDDRVGFFSVAFEDYDGNDHEVETIRYITRWRLEKKDPDAALSDPVKPIVFYVGKGVPDTWREYVHKGIEMWQPAFEAAGFSNAIIALDPPSEREDPDWDAEDARYSTIRWLPSTIENAMGPHVSDPRTGEILEADILMYHNVIKLVRDWYFVQASPNDPRAQKLPLPDDLVGEALAYVVAHEVGHSLGFPHNMKASSAYSIEQLRDAEFTAKNGNEASIMDYGRFNYVAQPGDGARLIPIVGPYDFFAVQWGYQQYADADAEKQAMSALVAKQVADPVLRFGSPNPGEDPSQQTEDLGADPILATTLGLKNIDRVASYLVDACCSEEDNYDLLRNMYDELLGQRNRELGHVASLVGGFVRSNLWYGDADKVYHPTPSARQREAIAFLHANAFETPYQLLDDDVLLRLEASGAPDRILSGQRRLLASLISEQRIDRMSEQAARSDDAYEPIDMMHDITIGLWHELVEPPVEIDLYRRNLQRAHIELLSSQLDAEDSEASDLPALSRGELAALLEAISAALEGDLERTTRLHLADMRARIREHLNPLLEDWPAGAPFVEVEESGQR